MCVWFPKHCPLYWIKPVTSTNALFDMPRCSYELRSVAWAKQPFRVSDWKWAALAKSHWKIQRASHVFDGSRASIIGHPNLQRERGQNLKTLLRLQSRRRPCAIFAVNDGVKMVMLGNVIVCGILLLLSEKKRLIVGRKEPKGNMVHFLTSVQSRLKWVWAFD